VCVCVCVCVRVRPSQQLAEGWWIVLEDFQSVKRDPTELGLVVERHEASGGLEPQ
jgi:hypothetical protein